jgi:short-subunit dehydrogenase
MAILCGDEGRVMRQSLGNPDKKCGAKGWTLVTGASAGIGLELARAFASRGHDLVLTGRNEKAIADLAREVIATYGVEARPLTADLSLPGAAEAIADAIARARVDVDVLVNNAGVLFEGDFVDVPLESHLRLLHTNIVAVPSLTRLFLPVMLERRRGRILNVASTAAFAPIARLAAYAAAKAYILSLTESLAEELQGTGVTATALCPGFTDTAMTRGSSLAKPVPAMMFMSAKDVAAAGCAACLKGEAICVPGVVNKVVAGGAPLLTRKLARGIGGFMNRGGLERIANVWKRGWFAARSGADR